MILSTKFEQALVYASIVHGGQLRKGTEIPYLSHLLGVASIALEYGANEDEAIAALLHDAVEDAGGSDRLEDIRVRFGDDVANIVDECTDAYTIPKPPWRERKEEYINHISLASRSARLISASDKLHNARSILKDYRLEGETLWSRFNGGKDGTLWYYRSLVQALRTTEDNELNIELNRVVEEIIFASGWTEPVAQPEVTDDGDGPLAEFCVYTILHTDKLDKALENGGVGEGVEHSVWRTAEALFRQAEEDGLKMAIIFAAADLGPPGLLYHGILKSVETDDEGHRTRYEFRRLQPIPERPPLSTLRKHSDNEPLSNNFIRPYCICFTPSFLTNKPETN
jgi:GTP pyrophosphokinase